MDLTARVNAFESSPSHSVWLEEKKLKRNFDIYNYNYKKAVLCIQKLEKKYRRDGLVGVGDWKFLSHKESSQIQARFIPLFANFLSSLYALENNLKEYSEKHDANNFKKEIFPYLESNISKLLLFALRNYFDHTGVYSINIGVGYVRREEKSLPTNIWDGNVFFAVNRIKFIVDLQDENASINPRGKHRFLHSPIKRKLLVEFLRKQKGSEINLKDHLDSNYSDLKDLFKLTIKSVRFKNPEIHNLDKLLGLILEEQYGYKEKITIK
jgi:hypothetical protein